MDGDDDDDDGDSKDDNIKLMTVTDGHNDFDDDAVDDDANSRTLGDLAKPHECRGPLWSFENS